MTADGSESDGSDPPQPPLSRADKVEIFDEEHMQHVEWESGEREFVEAVLDDLRDAVSDRDDARIVKSGRCLSHDGLHEVSLEVRVAGNAWVGMVDD